MIYLDNAANSGKKPEPVREAVARALRDFSVNAGRGGYAQSQKAAEEIYLCRKKLKEMFQCEDETQVVFVPSCTFAVNYVLKGVLNRGDHLIISSLEHNAVARPALALKKAGVEIDIAEVIFGDDAATLRAFANKIKPNTKMIFTLHASNVNGHVLPIAEIGALCRSRGILFGVDAAQSGGVLPIDMQEMQIDYLCLAPHKGLMAPMGTGVLIARKPLPKTVVEGGTGTESLNLNPPAQLPERLECGTLNLPGIFGISAGVDFVRRQGMQALLRHEMEIHKALYRGLSQISGIRIYSPDPFRTACVPVLAFNAAQKSSEETAEYLAAHDVAVRAGLHCAPLAHRSLGTIDGGAVRLSAGWFNTLPEAARVIFLLKNM